MAGNEKMMNDSSAQPGSSRDYKEGTRSQQEAKQTGSGVRSERDLGTVGGGTIPSAGVGSGTSPGGMNTSDSTVGAGGSTARSVAGAGSTTDRGNMTNRDLTTNAGNTVDRTAQGNLGGRNPSEPQTAMGDRDADIQRGHSSSTSPVQPTTSRDPGKINEDQDTEKGS